MPWALVAFVIAIGAVVLVSVSCARHPHASTGAPLPVTRQTLRSLSREQVEKKLKAVETRTAPEPKMGAMCYEMAAPPDRAEYVCPKCGEKTLYAADHAQFVTWELEACRREFDGLHRASDLALALDESSLCAHCSPAATEHHLALVVRYADGSSRTTAPVSHDDLRILRAFLKGELVYTTSNDGSAPLKDELPRLRTLLGIEGSAANP